jgi:hypothetical protein
MRPEDVDAPPALAQAPSEREFEDAAEELHAQATSRPIQLVRAAGILLVIVALVTYFAVPFGNPFGAVRSLWHGWSTGIHHIPLAPEHKSNPRTLG